MPYRLAPLCTLVLFAACSGEASRDPAAPAAPRLDVTDTGCAAKAIPDDGVDDAPAFACALDKLAARGGILDVPAGRFEIGATLVVPRHVTLEGVGYGSELAQPHGLLGPLLRMQAESIVRDLLLSQEQPAPGPDWQPYADYDFQIKIEGDQGTLEGVKLLNPYRGVLVAPAADDGAVGQVQIFNLRGQPLKEGIHIDHALDVIHVLEVHFWPFWSTDPGVLRWTATNGTALVSLRDDNPLLEKLFFFAYATGVELGVSSGSPTSGVTSKPKIAQLDCDACGSAVVVDGAGTRGVLLEQVSTQGFHGDWGLATSGAALLVSGRDTSVVASELDLAVVGANAVRVEGAGAVVRVSSSLIREWNVAGAGFPAFELADGSTGSSLTVSDTSTGEGHGAATAGAGVSLVNVQTGQSL